MVGMSSLEQNFGETVVAAVPLVRLALFALAPIAWQP